MIEGLIQLLERQRAASAEHKKTASESEIPAAAHHAGVVAEELDRECIEIANHILTNKLILAEIARPLRTLAAVPQSTHRQLAMRHLEDAITRLMLENGI